MFILKVTESIGIDWAEYRPNPSAHIFHGYVRIAEILCFSNSRDFDLNSIYFNHFEFGLGVTSVPNWGVESENRKYSGSTHI
jgi:hypothetical protein